MSSSEDGYPPVCEFCGTWITEKYQRCPALDDGYCIP